MERGVDKKTEAKLSIPGYGTSTGEICYSV